MNNNQSPSQPNNQQKRDWLPQNVEESVLHAKHASGLDEETAQREKEQMHQIKELIHSPETSTAEGTQRLGEEMGKIGLPGVYYKGRASEHISRREEAMGEEQGLRDQGKSFASLSEPETNEVLKRIHQGFDLRTKWRNMLFTAETLGVNFAPVPRTEQEKQTRKEMETILGSEVELEARRNSKLGINPLNKKQVYGVTKNLMTDDDFMRTVDHQAKTIKNVEMIKNELKKKLKEYSQDENSGDLQPGN